MAEGSTLQLDTQTPISRDPWLRVLFIILTIIASLYLVQMLWSLVGQFFDLIIICLVAWLISFVLRPAVDGLTRIPWLGQAGAVFVVYFALLIVIVASLVGLVPALVAQTTLAAEKIPETFDRAGSLAGGLTDFFHAHGLAIEQYTDQMLRPLESVGGLVVSNAVPLFLGAGSALAQILLTIIVSLYLMLDGDRMGHFIARAVPPRYRDDFVYFVSSVYKAFGGFLRGQIIQSLVYGVGVAVIMLGAGLPFVALASVVAGIGIFVPFLGPVLGVIPPLLVALTADFGRAIIVFILTMVLNLVVVNVVQPKVLSQQIGLHPFVVLGAVLIGVRIAGPWGALFGVPVAAVIVTMVSFYQLTVTERTARVREIKEPMDPVPDGTVHEQAESIVATTVEP
jgi:predicted PurR-regulated permease PerM